MRLEDWPKEVDVATTMRELHSTMTQTIFVSAACAWAREYGTFDLYLGTAIYSDGSLKAAPFESTELNEDIMHFTTLLDGLHVRIDTFEERAQTQINVVSD
jgi:hypothetical protein